LRYRPYIDGLRAVAVYLVVAFHAGLDVFRGGFIGVDVFFVLSGFLVTSILIRDLGHGGRIRAGRFYARRARRILPAAVVTLLVTAVVYAAVASPAEVLDAVGGFKAAFLYVANWYFIRQSNDYFAANVDTNPVLQFWSLAIEEQFYLVWPLLLSGLYLVASRWRRRRWWLLRILVVALGSASAIAALVVTRTDLARAYYGTDTRAYQLLAGAALALTPQLLRALTRYSRSVRWLAAVALVGLVVLATSGFDAAPISRGVVAVVLTTALLVALENAGGGAVVGVLSSRPLVYLGRISYGVYLWHWPVLLLATHDRSLSPIVQFAVACVAATALAAVSFVLVEQPLRRWRTLDRLRGPVIAAGFAASVVCGLVVIPVILDPGSDTVVEGSGASSPTGGTQLLDWRVARSDIPDLPDCIDAPVDDCTVVQGSGKRVVLIGDSNARMWIPAVAEIARRRNWNLSVLAYPTCPWQRGLQITYDTIDECEAHQTDWYRRVLPELDPELVILAHQAFDSPDRRYRFRANGTSVLPGTPELERALTSASSESLDTLLREGREVVILEPTPDAPSDADPLSCLSIGGPSTDCAYRANREPTPLERFYREQDSRAGVTTLDLDRLVCPRWPTCDAVVDDIIVKRDPNHITATYARALVEQLSARIP
jgi:peptidoglycan/LPS O-acetylase OafA/YrhL